MLTTGISIALCGEWRGGLGGWDSICLTGQDGMVDPADCHYAITRHLLSHPPSHIPYFGRMCLIPMLHAYTGAVTKQRWLSPATKIIWSCPPAHPWSFHNPIPSPTFLPSLSSSFNQNKFPNTNSTEQSFRKRLKNATHQSRNNRLRLLNKMFPPPLHPPKPRSPTTRLPPTCYHSRRRKRSVGSLYSGLSPSKALCHSGCVFWGCGD